MSKPAARIGDMTAHGGAIVVGCPNVLIGGMPAARVGDMHVCPQVIPSPAPILHVGGPIVLLKAYYKVKLHYCDLKFCLLKKGHC